MSPQRHILLPYLVVSFFLLLGATLFFFDSRTIVDAEEDEEENSKVLLLSEGYLSGLERTQIEQHHFLLSGNQRYLASYKKERDRTLSRAAELRLLLDEHFPDSLPKIDAAAKIQGRYFAELDRMIAAYAENDATRFKQAIDSERSTVLLLQIQLLLEQLAADVYENRNRINESVSFSVKRAGISIALMAVFLIVVLGFGYRITSRALTLNQQLAERLQHEATHDALTHLPNRRYFMDWIQRSVAMAVRNDFSIALLFIDLDGFKHVNDRHGHDAGDEVLRIAARRFQALMRESDLLVRLGGDEFAVLVSQAPANGELSSLAERIIAALEEPILAGVALARVGASIGIAVYPRHAGNANDLISAADQAMYRAKQNGKNKYFFFESSAAPVTGRT